MDTRMEKVMRALEKNNMAPFRVNTKAEVVPLVMRLLNEGDTVTLGGSQSLFEAGVIGHLACGRYRFLNRYAPGLTEADIRPSTARRPKPTPIFAAATR